jgi:putative aldouronate transport system substrate-binding protein
LGIEKQAGAGWIQTFISKDTKNPAILAKWMSYMSSPAGMLLSIYGIEGVHFNMVSSGYVKVTEKGIADKLNMRQTGVYAYWPFYDSSWDYSITPPPAAGDPLVNIMQISCALGKYKDTVIYDASLLTLPGGFIDPGSDIGIMQLQINNYQDSQISVIVTAASDAQFEQAYNAMISQLKTLGINQVDAKINEAVQANYRQYNARIQKVNP